ncbi:apolipoprotein N-acyltransferase [Methylobacterium planeticum]|uniref:apolipoprotein N-acyltransferase n=1 Tax=Methylobacterium planeticum TaxID=2615211 RepID=UPI001FEEAE14|nr:apolipoprotein N-acyltransferase [Methylobacterium planeticum]
MRLSGWFAALRGWRRLIVAFLAGALGALAMPPFGMLPALVLSLSVAVWLMDGAAASRARLRQTLLPCAMVGWAWGFGYLTAGLWWLGSAFLVEADEFAWALPLGVVGLPAALASFYAVGFAGARLLWSPGAGRICGLAVGLAGAEWLRGHLFTGFPWNTLGMALGQNLWLTQSACLVGLYGLTLVAILVCAAPATLATGTSALGRFGPSGVAAVILGSLALFGANRIPVAHDKAVAGVRLRLVQPNLPQDAKFRPENREDIVDRYIELSQRPPLGGPAPTHIIWPESAFPFLIQRDPASLARVAGSLQSGQRLITGAARAEEPLPGERLRYFNAIMTIEPPNRISDTYDKVHLVPFGEYLPAPLDALLRAVGLRQFVSIPGGFSAGSRAGQRILDVPGLPPAAATICYEAIFPGAIVPSGVSMRPGLILNVTNDAWFGDTPGPRQHLAQARLRAVEEGLPLVRDANTGISAIIDAYGRVTASLPLNEEAVLDADLPASIDAPTLYARFGDWPFLAMLTAALLCALGAWRRA